MEISNDIIFIVVIGLIALAIFCTCKNEGGNELREGFAPNIADADISAIRNLNGIATKLIAGGLTVPGHLNIINVNDNVMNVEGDGEHPYISLGKTGTWTDKKIYLQNVNSNTTDPTFRVGVHGKPILMDIGKQYGLQLPRKDGRTTHFDWSDGINYIRGNTTIDGNVTINGKNNIKGGLIVNDRDILAELDALNALNKNTIQKGNLVSLQINGNHSQFLSENLGRVSIQGDRGGEWSRWRIDA